MSRKKRIGYTLTELLVVVMIIAVLSAVVLPKFNKVLETRKTSEAEDLMTAVRQEQEYRCASDRPYATQVGDLHSIANANTKNYTFSFTSTGIEATRAEKDYKLSIPSYADGRICCEDLNNSGYCAELNKDYPSCTSLVADNFKTSPSVCAAEVPEEGGGGSECTTGDTQMGPCTSVCGQTGEKLVKECVNGKWENRNGACSALDSACSCEAVRGPKPDDTTEPCNGCGTRTISHSCNTTTWQWQRNEGECSRTAEECWCNPDLDGDIEDRIDLCTHNTYYPGTKIGTWLHAECKCDCGGDGEWIEGKGCVGKCDENKRNLCTSTSGLWAGYPHCSCQCGHDTWDDERGCVAEDNCTYQHGASLWDQEIEICLKWDGTKDRMVVPGVWDESKCECRCLKGSHSTGDHHCYLDQGVSIDGFEDFYGDCLGSYSGTDANCDWDWSDQYEQDFDQDYPDWEGPDNDYWDD